MPAKEDTTMPILAHVLGIVASIIGPLIILLVADDENSKNHARVVLNWQISAVIYVIVAVGFALTIVLLPLTFVIIFAVSILSLIFGIIGAVRASENVLYKYPLSIPFLPLR